MWSRCWELIALIASAAWCALLTTLGVLHLADMQEKHLELPPVIEWATEAKLADDEASLPELRGNARVMITPPRPEPVRIRYSYRAESSPDKVREIDRLIPPGADSLPLYFDLGRRDNPYADEIVTMTLMDGDGVTIAANTTRQIHFLGKRLVASARVTPNQIREGSEDEARFAVELAGWAPRDLDFEYQLGGDAVSSGCYIGDRPTRFTVRKGERISNELVLTRAQPLDDRDRSIELKIVAPDGVRLEVANITARCVARQTPHVAVAFEMAEIVEGGASTRLTARLTSGKVEQPITVTCRVAGGTAGTNDYTIAGMAAGSPIVLTLTPERPSAVVTVAPVDDAIALEGTKTLELEASVSANAKLANAGKLVLRIADKNPSALVELRREGNGALTEKNGGRVGRVTATLVGAELTANDIPIEVELDRAGTATIGPAEDVTVEGIDAKTRRGRLVISVGKGSASLTVTVVDDKVVAEGDETVVLKFTPPQGIKLQAGTGMNASNSTVAVVTTFRIEDDDTLRIVPLDTIDPIPETPSSPAVPVRIAKIEGESTEPLILAYELSDVSTATPGKDFVLEGLDPKTKKGTLTVPPKAAFVTLPLTTIPDSDFETNETVVLKFQGDLFAGSVLLTIQDTAPSGDVLLLIPASRETNARRIQLKEGLQPLLKSTAQRRLVGGGALVLGPPLEGRAPWTTWNLQGDFPVSGDQLFPANASVESQLAASFVALEAAKKKCGGRPLIAFVVWNGPSAPTTVRLLGAPAAKEQELYLGWIGGRRLGDIRSSDALDQALAGFGRPPTSAGASGTSFESIRYLETEADVSSDLIGILELRTPAGR